MKNTFAVVVVTLLASTLLIAGEPPAATKPAAAAAAAAAATGKTETKSNGLKITYVAPAEGAKAGDNVSVLYTGKLQDGTFVGEKDSLITKCPSKYTTEAQQDPEHVIITK